MNNHLLAATCTAYAPREIFFAPKSKCKHTSARHGRKKWTTTYMESDEVHINIDIDVHICVRALCTPLNNDVWQLVSRCIVIKSMKITMACASMCSCLPLPTVWMACNSLRNFQCRRSACVCVCVYAVAGYKIREYSAKHHMPNREITSTQPPTQHHRHQWTWCKSGFSAAIHKSTTLITLAG